MIDSYWRISSDFNTDIAMLAVKLEGQLKRATASITPGYTHMCAVYKISNPRVIITVDMIQTVTRTGFFKQLLGHASIKSTFTAIIRVEPENIEISNFVKKHLTKKLIGKSECSFALVNI